MIWIFCIILPPLAIVRTGKMVSFTLNVILTCLGWLPGVVHAFMVVSSWKADNRTNKIIKAINKNQNV